MRTSEREVASERSGLCEKLGLNGRMGVGKFARNRYAIAEIIASESSKLLARKIRPLH